MKTTGEQKKEFVFYRQNIAANRYTMTIDELKEQYRKFLSSKDIRWVEYYGHQTVSAFITDKEGLNSVVESIEIIELQKELMPIRHEFY